MSIYCFSQCAYFCTELYQPFAIVVVVVNLHPRYHQAQQILEHIPVLDLHRTDIYHEDFHHLDKAKPIVRH